MAYDDSIYGLTLDQWHRPGQTVVVNPIARMSDYGIPSLPASYGALRTYGGLAKGSKMVAVGSTVVLLGGHIGSTTYGAGYPGYAKKRLVGLNGGREWTAYDFDPPWAWPVVHGAWVIGSRIYVASDNYVVGDHTDPWTGPFIRWPQISQGVGAINMWYSDDLGVTWHNMKTPGIVSVGADNTDPYTNYDLRLQTFPQTAYLDYAYGCCIHKGYFVLVRERGIGYPNGGGTYWVQAFEVFTMPTPEMKTHGPESRSFRDLGWFLPGGKSYASTGFPDLSSDAYKCPSNILAFDDHILVGNAIQEKNLFGSYHSCPSKKWRMSFSENMESVSFEEETDETLINQTSFGVCSYRKQSWIYGGGLVTHGSLTDTPMYETGNYGTVASMTNRMLTSIDGKVWQEVSYGDSPPAYPTAGFQNVPVRCRYPSMVFIPGTKEILIGFCWIGHDYYDDTLGYLVNDSVSPRQMQMFMAFMHSSVISFPEVVPVETPWYNFPLGGSPGSAPDAPGESGDFTDTGDLFRCLRIDLENGDLTIGSGYPLVSTLQNSSPTSLSGQIPDKMLAGDKYGYLNKAMVPEAPGLGNSSRYTLWTIIAGATETVLPIDVTAKPNAYLQAHFLTGLPIRVQWTDGSWVESMIADNGNDTITLSSALGFIPAAGTKILIAPMDCAALLNETRYQYPARLVQARINVGNYQPDDQDLLIGIRTAQDRRRFGDFSTAASLIQTIRQRQLEAGGGVVGIAAKASRSLTYDLRFVPTGGGDLEIGPIILTENIAPGEKGLSQ